MRVTRTLGLVLGLTLGTSLAWADDTLAASKDSFRTQGSSDRNEGAKTS